MNNRKTRSDDSAGERKPKSKTAEGKATKSKPVLLKNPQGGRD